MYTEINRKSWSDILAENGRKWEPPLTVHLPIQPVHSRHFVHIDRALNACLRPVHVDLPENLHKATVEAKGREVGVVEFALDDPPYVPDFRYSTLSLAEGRYPVAVAEYSALDILYKFEYVCRSVDGSRQGLLVIRCTITNEGEIEQRVHVRPKLNFQKESQIFDYHYVPFYWDATKWLNCDSVALDGSTITKDGSPIGAVVPGVFDCEWQESADFDPESYNQRFRCETPYFVSKALRLTTIQNVLHLSALLQPGESQSFTLAVFTNWQDVTEPDRQALDSPDFDQAQDAAINVFQSHLSGATKMAFAQDNWDDIFSALQISSLQLLVDREKGPGLMPTQGGSSERHFVWVWEAVVMLMPMLSLGYFGPVRKAIDFIFSLQDGGYPPEGDFTTLEGAIGTTGPRWINSTGSALALAADFYRYSRDESYLDEYLPRIVKAAHWIVGELGATRKLNADGSRPTTYGIMPYGCATDGDKGYIIAFSDAYTFWGLEKTVKLLEDIGHTSAEEFRQELEQYRDDIGEAVKRITRPDGYIERKVMTGERAMITAKFENIAGAVNLAYAGAIDADTDAFRAFARYYESNLVDGYFMGKMDREIRYMGIGEWHWQHIYLSMGEWKKAFAAAQTNLNYGMTQDTYQVQERFSVRNPAFTPWQPNGSGNGKMLDIMIKSIYFVKGSAATILGGIPFAWLRSNGDLALTSLFTPAGRISIEGRMTDTEEFRLKLSGALPSEVAFPDHFAARSESSAVTALGGGRFTLKDEVSEVVFVLADCH